MSILPCITCSRKTEYREDLKIICSPLCQLLSRLSLSLGEKPIFINDDETWENVKTAIDVLTKERNEEMNAFLDRYFSNQLREFESLQGYLHLVLQLRKHTVELESVESEIEEKRVEFNRNDFPMEPGITSDVALVHYYFQEFSMRVIQIRLTLVSLVERKMELSEIVKVIEEKLVQSSLLTGRVLEDESIYNDDLIKEIEEVEEKKLAFLRFFQNLTLYDISEIDDLPENNLENRVEVEPGMTEQQKEVFLEIEEKIKLYEDVDMKSQKKTGNLFIKDYILGCDVIIHLPLATVLDQMNDSDDIYLRNLFETGKSCGLNDERARARWENKIFDSQEYDSFNAHDKVKYGTVNLTRTNQGVFSLWNLYGKSYLILKPEVKSRCTYSKKDSSSKSVTGPHDLGTTRFMANLTTKFTNKEKRAMERGDKEQILEKSYHYMEVQIHGELSFARDVAMIMIDSAVYGYALEDSLQTLFENIGHKIPYQVFS